MKSYKQLLKWGALLLGICWIGYFQLLYPKVSEQIREVEQAIDTGEGQLKELSDQTDQLHALSWSIKGLQLEYEGTKRILPPQIPESQWIEVIYNVIGEEKSEALQAKTLGKEEMIQRIEISGISTLEEVKRLLKSLREGRRLVQVESLNLEALMERPFEEEVYMQLFLMYHEDEMEVGIPMKEGLLQGMIPVVGKGIELINDETYDRRHGATLFLVIEEMGDGRVQCRIRNGWEEKGSVVFINDLEKVEELELIVTPTDYEIAYEGITGDRIGRHSELPMGEIDIKIEDRREEPESISLRIVINSSLTYPLNIDIPEHLRGEVVIQWVE